MPVIRIENYQAIHINRRDGNPHDTDEEVYAYWRFTVRAAMARAGIEAGLAGITKRRHMTIVFGERFVDEEVDGDVNPEMAVIIIEGLFARSDRTVEDRRRFAATIGLALRKYLPRGWEVEVIPSSYDAVSEGFISIAPDGTASPAA